MAALAYFVTTLRAKFEDKEKGATAVEYGLLIAFISVVLVAALVLIGDDIMGTIQTQLTSLGE